MDHFDLRMGDDVILRPINRGKKNEPMRAYRGAAAEFILTVFGVISCVACLPAHEECGDSCAQSRTSVCLNGAKCSEKLSILTDKRDELKKTFEELQAKMAENEKITCDYNSKFDKNCQLEDEIERVKRDISVLKANIEMIEVSKETDRLLKDCPLPPVAETNN